MTITIDLAPSGALRLAIPSPDLIHHLDIPITLEGLRLLRGILAKRQCGTATKISQAENPTQAQVNAWLRTERAQRAAEANGHSAAVEAFHDRKAAKLFAGVDIGELDL